MKLVSMEDYLMGRIKIEDLDGEQTINLNTLIPRINDLLSEYNKEVTLHSGYRSPADQARINPKASKSKHLVCAAIDLGDKDRGTSLRNWCLTRLDLLVKIGLWMEDPSHTLTWVHLQCIPPKSGYRIFIP